MRFYKMAVAIDHHHHHHHHGFKPFRPSRRCRLQSFTQLDQKLVEFTQTNLNLAQSLKEAFKFANFHRSVSTPCLSLATRVDEDFDTNPRIEIVGGRGVPRVRALVVEVAVALASGVNPLPVSSGLGGAYFLRGRNGDNIALAKPIDEEPLAFNNPKGFGGQMLGQPGLKRSVRVGETGIRELAAYLLDNAGFAGVPPTALVKISNVTFPVQHPSGGISATPHKIASLQCFVEHDFDAGELGPSSFSVASVHRIGIFDIRILNLDRHAGNILVKKYDHHELVPIDHGLCLPEWLDDPYFEWLHWPQAVLPFSESELEYISKLDPFQDAELLRRELPSLRESSIRVLILCTIFLKGAAAAGLCLSDIGEMMTRDFHGGQESSSALENLCKESKSKLCNIFINEMDDQNRSTEECDEESDIFQFDDDDDDDDDDDADTCKLDTPVVTAAKPPKIPRFSSVKSMPGLSDSSLSLLYEENEHNNNDFDNHDSLNKKSVKRNGSSDNEKSVILTRSISFAVEKYNTVEVEFTCFGDMNDDEWELFLDSFEKLLPEVFESTKCTNSRQRLGTSCEF